MAVSLPNGSTISIGATFGASKTMSAITNASPAVATLEASHLVIVNDIVTVTSGWSRLNGRVVRASAVATNDVTFEGIDTSDTARFPASGGAGSVVEVATWQQITQILDAQTSGGEQQFAEYSFLEDDTDRRIPTRKSAKVFTFQLADDQSLAHYAVLKAADESRVAKPVKVALASGAIIYMNGYITIDETPTLTKDEVMAISVTVSIVAPVTRYAS